MCIVLVNIKPNVLSMPTFCYPTFLLRSLQTWVENTDYMAAWFFSTKISIIPPSTIFCAFCGEKMVPAHFKNYDRNVGRGLSVAWIMVNVWKQKHHIFRIQVTFSVRRYLYFRGNMLKRIDLISIFYLSQIKFRRFDNKNHHLCSMYVGI